MELLEILQKHTSDIGDFSIEFNPHKGFYEKDEYYINGKGNRCYYCHDKYYSLHVPTGKKEYHPQQEYYLDNLDENEIKNIDFNKDVYVLIWHNETPVGFYYIIKNSLSEITETVLNIISRDDIKQY